MKKIIDIENLNKNYGQNSVLNNFNLNVNEGEIFVLLGKNGSGKSTLFKIIAQLTRPTSGSISLSSGRENIGLSINEPIFYEHLNAVKNLEIHCGYLNVDSSKNKIQQILNLVGLSEMNDAPIKTYSMGMRQRLALARCLINNPNLLILDEPLNGLDPSGIKQFREIIINQSNQGKTVLMASHVLSEAVLVASRIGIIFDGSIVLNEEKKYLIKKYGDDLESYLIEKMNGGIIDD